MNNIFAYAPKELTTDAFLKWLFLECNENSQFHPYALDLFSKICRMPCLDPIENVECLLQTRSVDLLLGFSQGDTNRKVLFENKTWTSIHSDQLKRYRKNFPDCDKYIYLKLGFIDYQEAEDAAEAGFIVTSSKNLLAAIEPIQGKSLISDQYLFFLKHTLIENPRNGTITVFGERSHCKSA